MKLTLTLLIALIFWGCKTDHTLNSTAKRKWSIALHGGAGYMKKENFSTEQVKAYKKELNSALEIGKKLLAKGKSSTEVVEKVVMHLEDCPLFNAGKGAVFTHTGINELDAAIMDGKSLNAGAVASVGNIKNPVCAAKAVMEKSPHVMLIGKGASIFASDNNIEMVDSSYFYTGKRWLLLQKALEKSKKMGTVGCVALDMDGNLAAATSTGGMTNKKYGRVGDVPIIGAGTYANNKTCAVSATGHGEYFIRYTVAHDISALMEYKGLSLQDAANEVVNKKLKEARGNGGVIAVDKYGNVVLTMNTSGMFRAFATSDGNSGVAIFKE